MAGGEKKHILCCNGYQKDITKEKKNQKISCPAYLDLRIVETQQIKWRGEHKNLNHNHPPREIRTRQIQTPEKLIIQSKTGKFVSIGALQSDLKDNTSIPLISKRTLYYMQDKIYKENFGSPSEDAFHLIEILKKNSCQAELHFEYQANEQIKLQRLIIITN